jgi:uncharacterized protein YcfJ
MNRTSERYRHWCSCAGFYVFLLVLIGTSTVYAQASARSKSNYRVCQQYAEKEAERQGSLVGGAAQGAMKGAVMGVVLGGSQGAQQGAMLGLVVGGHKRNQERKQFYEKAYAQCRDGRVDI